MKINHKLIREIIKWVTFIVFAISVVFKLKAIIKYGGVKVVKDPNDSSSSNLVLAEADEADEVDMDEVD